MGEFPQSDLNVAVLLLVDLSAKTHGCEFERIADQVHQYTAKTTFFTSDFPALHVSEGR